VAMVDRFQHERSLIAVRPIPSRNSP
jgi:hypothetical protein